jgi:hypothetical protein
LFCVPAQSSGTRSRVRSSSTARYADTASSSRAVPLSRAPSVSSARPRLFCVPAQSSGTRSRALKKYRPKVSFWVENGGRASQAIYCASVSPSVRCVSPIVRLKPSSVSDNVRRKRRSIARRAIHHCAPLQLGYFANNDETDGLIWTIRGSPFAAPTGQSGGVSRSCSLRPSRHPVSTFWRCISTPRQED